MMWSATMANRCTVVLLCLLSPALSRPGTRHIHIQLLPRGPVNRTVGTSILDCPANPDKIISIVLKPRTSNSTSAAVDNNRLCGLDESIDPERLLSEWNGPYIFDLLNKKDPNPLYTTQVYEVCSFSKSGDLTTTTTSTTTTTTISTTATNSPTLEDGPTRMPEAVYEEPALYSLFVAPPTSDCNMASLDAAVTGKDGFLSVFIGFSPDLLPQKEMFLNDVDCLKSGYGGIKPKLCATKLHMVRQQSESRLSALTQIFNFPYIEQRQLTRRTLKQCNSRSSTEDTIHKFSFFDTTSPIKFKLEREVATEADGFVKIEIQRTSQATDKMVGNLKTSTGSQGNSASKEDFYGYDGPVVFEKGKSVTEVIIGIKRDNNTEMDELFMVSLNLFSFGKRKKRSKEPLYITIVHGAWRGDLTHTCPTNEVPDPRNPPTCVTADHFLAEFDNALERGPFRTRDWKGGFLPNDTPQFLPVLGAPIDPAHRTRYKSTYDARLNIPIRAVITLDQYARPTPCDITATPPDCNWNRKAAGNPPTNGVLERPKAFETDLRERVRPQTWYVGDRSSTLNLPLPRGDAFVDYTVDLKYSNQWTQAPHASTTSDTGYQKGHLVSSNIFRTFFRKETDHGYANIVFDYATYMTNIFPQKDRISNWATMELAEADAAKYCLQQNANNKFHIVKGTIPSGPGTHRTRRTERYMENFGFTGFDPATARWAPPGKGFTNVNIPRYIYSGYCCSTHYPSSAKFNLFEHAVEGITNGNFNHDQEVAEWNENSFDWNGNLDVDLTNYQNDAFKTEWEMTEFMAKLRELWREQHPPRTFYETPRLFEIVPGPVGTNPCGTPGTPGNLGASFDY